MKKKHYKPSDSALKQTRTTDEAPSSLNPRLAQQRKKRTAGTKSVDDLVNGILQQDRIALAQAITLIESSNPKHQETAQAIIEACLPHSGNSLRIGITGTPGVGKSTFIEALGQYIIDQGHRPAILAIDPSSQLSKGSILGDKTRMEKLSQDSAAFIRPSPTGGSLGGVARKTRESILLCEAAQFDVILIETVGVGQSETSVHAMVDFFLLLILPGAGDELQGIKRGIVEMADLIAVNKADGERAKLAKQAKRAYANALHLFPPKASQWIPPVHSCSALEQEGLQEIWESVQAFETQTKSNDFFYQQRNQQALDWFRESISQQLGRIFYEHPAVQKQLPEMEAAILAGRLSSFQAASRLLSLFVNY
ncbi:MAG: methylmalonyl Co-A mutase-associated GTPase MeaB [Saprospiraceae bacterium]|nr:methylmalonyl Co-A mutase-associated GTPase MeaB [Saprospiraceae bacterium]